MENKLRLSVQTGDWYDELFGADEGVDEAFRFIKECGFDVLDYNIDHQLSVNKLKQGEVTDYFDVSDEEFLERFVTVKEAMKRLNAREKNILKMRFFLGRTQMEIANEIN